MGANVQIEHRKNERGIFRMTDYKPEPYNLSRPPHMIANAVIRRIEARNSISLGELSHADVEQLVSQYQQKLVDEEQKLLRELHARQERIKELETRLAPFIKAAKYLQNEDFLDDGLSLVDVMSGNRVRYLELQTLDFLRLLE